MLELITRTAALFESTHGHRPDGIWSAPGRVNLIGEHTDYNQGFVLPFAINRRTFAVASAVQAEFATLGYQKPEIFAVSASEGAKCEI